MLTTFEQLSAGQALEAAGVFNIARTLPAFVVGGLLVTLVVRHRDENFDWLRLNIRGEPSVVAKALRSGTNHAIAGASDRATASRQAHALLTTWVRANARAYAYQDTFQLLALGPCVGPIFVAALRIRRGAD